MSKLHLAAAVLAALLAACAPQVREQAQKQAELPPPPEFPEAYYRQLAVGGKPVFRVDPAASLVVIEVRRAGSLARFGHDHVVASHNVGGYVAPDEGRADLYVPLESLAVDEPALRAEAGFDTQPSESDIAGTRGNMLEKVLEAEKFPFALIRVSGVKARQKGARLTVAITLHGTSREVQAPAQVETNHDRMSVSGRMTLNQSDFGIAPFSILGGAIAVQDRMDLRFQIRARRAE